MNSLAKRETRFSIAPMLDWTSGAEFLLLDEALRISEKAKS